MAAVCFFVIFVTIVSFQRTSLAATTRVGIVTERLVDVPRCKAEGQRQNDIDDDELHVTKIDYSRASFRSSTLLMT